MSKLLCNVLKISGGVNAPPGCAPDVNCLKICTNSVNNSLKFKLLSVFTSVLFIGALLASHDGIFILCRDTVVEISSFNVTFIALKYSVSDVVSSSWEKPIVGMRFPRLQHDICYQN